MAYENQPNYVNEMPGEKILCLRGASKKSLIVMTPTKSLIQGNHL